MYKLGFKPKAGNLPDKVYGVKGNRKRNEQDYVKPVLH